MANPDSTFVYRAGPLEFDGRDAYWYIMSPPPIDEAFFAESDVEGLARIKAALPGRALECEPALAAAGGPLGYTVRPPTPIEINARAKLWLNAEAITWYASINDDVAQDVLIRYGARLAARGASLRGIIELDVTVGGHALAHVFDEDLAVVWTGDRGLFLFENHQAMRAFQDATVAGDLVTANAIPRWALKFVRGSEGLQQAMREAYGVPTAPVLMHDGPDGRRWCDDREAWRMGLVLRAIDVWGHADAERALDRYELDAGVAAALECGFVRALVDGPEGSLRVLSWPGLVEVRS